MAKKPERNDPCHCGSGKKYKNCCQNKDSSQFTSKLGMIGLAVAIVLGLIIVGMALSGGEGQHDCPAGTSWSQAHQHCH
ncbi:MAG: hypothetical protein GVY07_15005 [Bacteroidetes bacterium]|jgi:hypothetical protein|nr:hypothetical protein [Bacteroidota bacterium]